MYQHGVRGRRNAPVVVHAHFVEETLLRRGTDGEVRTIVTLTALAKDVRRRVPPHALSCARISAGRPSHRVSERTLWRLKVEELQPGGLFERTLEVPELAVDLHGQVSAGCENARTDLGDDGLLSERLGDAQCDLEGGGLPADALLDGSVEQSDLDRDSRLRCARQRRGRGEWTYQRCGRPRRP